MLCFARGLGRARRGECANDPSRQAQHQPSPAPTHQQPTAKDFSIGNILNVAALLYLAISNPAYSSLNFLSAFMLDRKLYLREQSDGMYRPTVYLIWKMADELAINLVLVTVMVRFFRWLCCRLWLWLLLWLEFVVEGALSLSHPLAHHTH